MPKVLIADEMSPKAAEIFRARGVDFDEITGLSKDELIKIIGNYDGIAVRSTTKAAPGSASTTSTSPPRARRASS
jgi:D-3-phosphoglycerate dehydrogenase